jgi:hypothetical protein
MNFEVQTKCFKFQRAPSFKQAKRLNPSKPWISTKLKKEEAKTVSYSHAKFELIKNMDIKF